MKILRTLSLLTLLVLIALPAVHTSAQGPAALVMTMSGPISPATLEYLKRGIQEAERVDAPVLIVQLNTPGGGIDFDDRDGHCHPRQPGAGGCLRQPAGPWPPRPGRSSPCRPM